MSLLMLDNGYFADGSSWGIFYQGENCIALMWFNDDEENAEYIIDGSYDFCLRKIQELDTDILVELKGI